MIAIHTQPAAIRIVRFLLMALSSVWILGSSHKYLRHDPKTLVTREYYQPGCWHERCYCYAWSGESLTNLLTYPQYCYSVT